MLSAFLWTLISICGVFVCYTRYLDFNRDVPPEYLNQQSVLEQTRKPNELAIHKSTKLDYSTGLRVGLGIRYDSYKLRNGNLNDIWEIFIKSSVNNEKPRITVGGESIRLDQLNHAVHQLLELMLTWKNVSELALSSEILFADKYTFAAIIAAFLSQIPVHVYEKNAESLIDENAVLVTEGFEIRTKLDNFCLFQFTTLDFSSGKKDFINEYTVEKDRGIALKVSSRMNHKVISSTVFTQLNLVSAVASCIKHLPPSKQLNKEDTIVIVQDRTSSEGLLNEITKVLTLFVAGSKLVLTSHEADYMTYKPTVLVMNVRNIKKHEQAPSALSKFVYYHKLFSLSRLRFGSSECSLYPDLRLIYVHRDCNKGEYTNWNSLRASLGVNIVEEIGRFNIMGPFLITDYFEYRVFPQKLSESILAAGGIVQANEIKLLNYDATQSGDLAVRGYNIGKAVTIMEGVGETKVIPDEDGFHKLPHVARWGTDGCLYILNRNR